MMSVQQKQMIQQQTGKHPDQMSDEELEAAAQKAGIDMPPEEPEYLAELEKLAELKEKGIITDEEFETKKKQLMGL